MTNDEDRDKRQAVLQASEAKIPMPVKYYCDRCQHEVIDWNTVSHRAIIDFEGWQAEVMLRNPNKIWNDGILCEDCLRLLLQRGDFHPKTGSIAQSQKSLSDKELRMGVKHDAE